MKTQAVIARIRQETPTVKSFRLALRQPGFSFLPGQWVDLYASINGVTMVGGYSITSSPLDQDSIELAIKAGGHNPVALYLHHGARVGDVVDVDGGHGDFFFKRGMGDSLTLLAGGIGITPLVSIFRYIREAAPEVAVTCVVSASTPSELLFRDLIEQTAACRPLTRGLFTVTKPNGEPWAGHVGRIDADWLQQEGVDLGSLFYLCGPPGMPEGLAREIMRLGVPVSRIRFEQWW